MNTKPHSHKLKLELDCVTTGGWRVVYGDTLVYVTPFGRYFIDHVERFPAQWRIRRAARKAIRRHDRGSIRAGIRAGRQAARGDALAELNARLVPDRWASDMAARRDA